MVITEPFAVDDAKKGPDPLLTASYRPSTPHFAVTVTIEQSDRDTAARAVLAVGRKAAAATIRAGGWSRFRLTPALAQFRMAAEEAALGGAALTRQDALTAAADFWDSCGPHAELTISWRNGHYYGHPIARAFLHHHRKHSEAK